MFYDDYISKMQKNPIISMLLCFTEPSALIIDDIFPMH